MGTMVLHDFWAVSSDILISRQIVLLSFWGSTVFLDLHSEQRIREALAEEDIYFVAVQGEIVGTGSIRGNEICRLFILPEYQAKGYGNRLMGRRNGVFMRDKGRMETEDIILGKAKYEDWRSIYRNVWSRPETAEYMVWKVTADEDEARERIRRTITWQDTHDAWLVYERGSGQAIGFAGVEEIEPYTYHETGIALGPEYVGRGYGKQILGLLMEYCISLGGQEFYYSTRAGNLASKALALSCGLTYQCSEQKTDQCSGKTYELEIYAKNLKDT